MLRKCAMVVKEVKPAEGTFIFQMTNAPSVTPIVFYASVISAFHQVVAVHAKQDLDAWAKKESLPQMPENFYYSLDTMAELLREACGMSTHSGTKRDFVATGGDPTAAEKAEAVK